MIKREMIDFYSLDQKTHQTQAYNINGVYVHHAYALWTGGGGEGFDPDSWAVVYLGYMIYQLRSLVNAVLLARELAPLLNNQPRDILLQDEKLRATVRELVSKYVWREEDAYDYTGLG